MRRIFLSILATLICMPAFAVYKMANVVCFVKFADQQDQQWDNDFDYYDKLFNDRSDNANSVANYFHDMSYGRMDWESSIIRTEYVDSHNRAYFLPKSDSNPEGYSNLDMMFDTRIRTLIKDMCAYVDRHIPEDVVVDANNDGMVDNMVIIICGNSDISASRMLWPANNTNSNSAVTINGKTVHNYLKVFDGANGYKSLSPVKLNTGVLCHEMTHTLNAFDLYARSDSKLTPIGVWDLMSDNGTVPQSMSAYTRMTYGKNFGNWIDDSEVTDVTTDGDYALNPLNSPTQENTVIRIRPDANSKEYFLLEYRDRNDTWDKQLPKGGLLVYKATSGYQGNIGADNKYELYVFRPSGSTTKNGTLRFAPLGPETDRTSFGATGDSDYPFYENGDRAPFSISDVRTDNGKIKFHLSFASSGIGKITAPENQENTIYTIDGLRINEITTPGLYIINGRKVAVN